MKAYKQQHPIVYFLFLAFVGCINTPLPAMERPNNQSAILEIKIKKGEINLEEKQKETILFFSDIFTKNQNEIVETFKKTKMYYDEGIYDGLTIKDGKKECLAILSSLKNSDRLVGYTIQPINVPHRLTDIKNFSLLPLIFHFLCKLDKDKHKGNVRAYVHKKNKIYRKIAKNLKLLGFDEEKARSIPKDYTSFNLSSKKFPNPFKKNRTKKMREKKKSTI